MQLHTRVRILNIDLETGERVCGRIYVPTTPVRGGRSVYVPAMRISRNTFFNLEN